MSEQPKNPARSVYENFGWISSSDLIRMEATITEQAQTIDRQANELRRIQQLARCLRLEDILDNPNEPSEITKSLRAFEVAATLRRQLVQAEATITEQAQTIAAHEESLQLMGRNNHDLAMKVREAEATIARLTEERDEWKQCAHDECSRKYEVAAARKAAEAAKDAAEAALRECQDQRDFKCPNGRETYEVCACSQATDGHCMCCCRDFTEHAASPKTARVVQELIQRVKGAEAECASLRQQLGEKP